MVLPSDYLGPDAKEHDLGRLTHALISCAGHGQKDSIDVRYCQMPVQVEHDMVQVRTHMQHTTPYDVDISTRTIILQSPSIIEINTDIIPILSWIDMLASFEHELKHHSLRTASFRKVRALASDRREKENSRETRWRLQNMVRFAHDLEELFAYEQGVENERSTRGFRRVQINQYHKHLDSIIGVIQSDEELYGTPIFEPLPLSAVLEGAYRVLTGEDVDTYEFLIQHKRRPDTSATGARKKGYAK